MMIQAPTLLTCYLTLAAQQYLVTGIVSEYVKKTIPEDDIIQSKNFPGQYPNDFNMTWEWVVGRGQWAVYFMTFELDQDDSDWLEVYDSARLLRFTIPSSSPPEYITSKGPQLKIRFQSDRLTQKSTRGFKLVILYGKSLADLTFKMHDLRKTRKESGKDSKDTAFLTIALIIVCLILVLVLISVVCWRRASKRGQLQPQRDNFGVRRNSGIAHTRAPQSSRRVEVNGTIGVVSSERPTGGSMLQRSDSRLGWMARAEHTTSIQTAGRTPRPNIYTATAVTRAVSKDDLDQQNSSGVGATASSHSFAARPNRKDSNQTRRKNISTSEWQQTSNTNVSFRSYNSEENSLVEQTLVGEYSNTTDSLRQSEAPSSPYENVMPPLSASYVENSHRRYVDEHPPPYTPIPTTPEATSSDCYENIPIEFCRNTNPSSQTNIYINRTPFTVECNGLGNNIIMSL